MIEVNDKEYEVGIELVEWIQHSRCEEGEKTKEGGGRGEEGKEGIEVGTFDYCTEGRRKGRKVIEELEGDVNESEEGKGRIGEGEKGGMV